MSGTTEAIGKALLDAALEELKDVVEREELKKYIQDKTQAVGKQLVLAAAAAASGNDRKRQEAVDNVTHLRSQVKMEVAGLRLSILGNAEDTVVRIIKAVFTTAVKVLAG